MSILRNLFTGVDGITHDIGRYLAAGTGAGAIFFQGWDVIVNHVAFDCTKYGMGVGALAAGIGAFQKLKENQEPKP